MIIKELSKNSPKTLFEKSGLKAEKQMAFYLKRSFSDIEDIFVINDLRIEYLGEIAQVDHLILHKFGFIFIESKSVTTKVAINNNYEWSRFFNGEYKGMPSPLEQAERQKQLIKKVLKNHESTIFKKKAFLTAYSIDEFKFDVLVAISDDGIIERGNAIEIPNVLKAEQITKKINSIIEDYSITFIQSLLKPTKPIHAQLKTTVLSRIEKTLLGYEKPIDKNSTVQKNKSINNRDTLKQENSFKKTKIKTETFPPRYCKCGSENIEMLNGRYSYYFKCADCKGNTAIKLTCKHPSCKPKISKRKLKYYQVCKHCDTSELYFIGKD